MKWTWKRAPRPSREADLKEELDAHLRIEEAEQRQGGLGAEEAERAARVMFGNVVRVQEDVREQWGWAGLERFVQDVRFGVRLLRRSPVWTAVVCLTLALGIGMSTAIFSVVHAVLLQPLPFPDPERVVSLQVITAGAGKEEFHPNFALWTHWRKTLRSVEDLALTRPVANFNFTGDGPPERLQGSRTTFNLTRVLGVRPKLGRMFTEEEQLADANVAVLSHALWVRRFGADPTVVGRKVQMNGTPFEILGVMSADFRYPDARFELWAPLAMSARDIGHGKAYGFRCVGRLKKDVPLAHAKAELQGVMQDLAREFPVAYRAGNDTMGALIRPLAVTEAVAIRPTLLMLSAAVACLLAIGCMNLGVLLIAKASGRMREILVRVALGAGRARLRQQLMAEAVPLALAGAAGGILLAYWLLGIAIPLMPAGVPRAESIGLNGSVVAFSVVCSVGIVLIASLLPASVAKVRQISGLLQQYSRGVAGSNRLRNLLVVGQVAVAMLLLFGGLLMGRSFAALLGVQPGFAHDGVLTMHLAVTRAKFPQDEQIAAYYRRLTERIRSIPGVVEAGVVNRLPLSGVGQTGGLEFEGRTQPHSSASMFMVDWRSATPGYFGAMGIPLLKGRLLNEGDTATSPRVGLIDAQLARQVFGDENPIGTRFRQSIAPDQPSDEPWSEIVGVVGHVLNDSLEKDARPQAYWPETQRAQERGVMVVRVSGDAAAYTKAVIAEIHAENPDQPVFDVRTMKDWMTRSMQTRTVTTSIVSLFGLASVVLACLGLYGVISYAAGLRLREFGIRLALGARATEVVGAVLGQAGRMVSAGVVIGLALCWPAAKALRGFLYGVGEVDWVSWTLAPALLICVGLLAGLGPALRAARTDPAQTLRAE